MKAEERAAKIIDEYCIRNPKDLNIEDIAAAENLFITESPLENLLGMINYEENYGLITINSSIVDAGQRKFTIVHEMGHFFNEREKPEHLRGCSSDDLNTYRSSKRNEDNANEFAAELLMHKPWFSEYIKKRNIDFELIKELADHFNVSLTAAALRYINIGKYPAALIYTKDGKVKWSAFNDYFPFKYIPIGLKVPKESATSDFFNGNTMQTCYDLIRAKAWFSSDFKCKPDTYLYEQSVAMPAYNATLTLVWEDGW